MDVETKMDLAKKPPTEEILMEDELRTLFQTKVHTKRTEKSAR